MSLTYEWKLTNIKKATTTDLSSDAVIGTQWKVIATDGDGNEGTFSGATPFKLQEINPDNFIAFEDLTENIVLDWIKSYVSGSGTFNNGYWDHISEQINKQIERTKFQITDIGASAFPWSTGSIDDSIVPPTE